MAVPFRRTSKAKKRKRRTHVKLQLPGMNECSNCGEYRLSH
ncbi:50S ribosomal protein L32, partial [Escherichia coli]|nr:50S ribosomal protein L32 [Escherichia coli]